MKNLIQRILTSVAGWYHRMLQGGLIADGGVLAGILLLNGAIFARLLFSGEYTFGGDSYLYWSFKYMVLYSVKYFHTLPWWDPMSYGGFPLYFHLISGWQNYLSPYYLPSLLLFKVLNLFADISINWYMIFHQAIYMNGLVMVAVYLLGRELTRNRIAAALPVFLYAFSYFQLLNFHDFYAVEAMIAPLFYIYGLVRLNNRRTKGSLVLFLALLGLLFASIDNATTMSAVFWSGLFSVLLLAFHPSLLRSAVSLARELYAGRGGKVLLAGLAAFVLIGFLASFSSVYLNYGHVLKYRGEAKPDGSGEYIAPLSYEASGGITEKSNPTVDITTGEIWNTLNSWIPFPDIHHYLMRYTWDDHYNLYIGLLTLPLIFAGFVLGARDRYVYILFFSYFFVNAFMIYGQDNFVYKILLDQSEIARNLTNLSTILPRGGAPVFLLLLAGMGLDRLLSAAVDREQQGSAFVPFDRLLRCGLALLALLGIVLIGAGVLSSLEPYPWARHTLIHMGIYLFLFTAGVSVLLISDHVVTRRSIVALLFLLAMADMTIAQTEHISTSLRHLPPNDTSKHVLIPLKDLERRGMTVPEGTEFRPATREEENMFSPDYVGVYHNCWRIQWSTREWLVLGTREQGGMFLPNWNPVTLKMTAYPVFQIYRNGYYLPFDRIRDLDSDPTIYAAKPLFYLHDEQLVLSKTTNPQDLVQGSYSLEEYTFNTVRLTTTTDRDGFLLFLDNIDPFWSASVDGKAVKIHRANFTFKAIELPAGTHTVTWSYFPWPAVGLYGLFYLGIVVLAVLVYRSRECRALEK